jgi:hypothetical protein
MANSQSGIKYKPLNSASRACRGEGGWGFGWSPVVHFRCYMTFAVEVGKNCINRIDGSRGIRNSHTVTEGPIIKACLKYLGPIDATVSLGRADLQLLQGRSSSARYLAHPNLQIYLHGE